MNNSTIQATPTKLLDIWGLMTSGFLYTSKEIATMLSFDSRQGQYYGEALTALEIANKSETKNPTTYNIKKEYTNLIAEERSKALFKIMQNKTLIEEIKSKTLKLKGETIKRRIKDLNGFVSFKVTDYSRDLEYKGIKVKPWDLDSNYELRDAKKSDEKIKTETIKDKSRKHKIMMNKIIAYAEKNSIPIVPEYMNIDCLSHNKKNKEVVLLELKSYDGLYMAIGQLLHYENKLKTTLFKDQALKYKKIYVSNTKISKDKKDLLKKLNIRYFNIQDSPLKSLFNIWQ